MSRSNFAQGAKLPCKARIYPFLRLAQNYLAEQEFVICKFI